MAILGAPLRTGHPMIPFYSDGDTADAIGPICVALLQGRVLHAQGHDGRMYSAGPYRTAIGEPTFTVIAWGGNGEQEHGDPFDTAALFVAQLSRQTVDELLAQLCEREAP